MLHFQCILSSDANNLQGWTVVIDYLGRLLSRGGAVFIVALAAAQGVAQEVTPPTMMVECDIIADYHFARCEVINGDHLSNEKKNEITEEYEEIPSSMVSKFGDIGMRVLVPYFDSSLPPEVVPVQ